MEALDASRERHRLDRAEADGLTKRALERARAAVKLVKTLEDGRRDMAASLIVPSEAKDASEPTTIDVDALDLSGLETLQATLETSSVDLASAIQAKLEALNTSVRKWQREAKAYRDRAHKATHAAAEKIAFRKCVCVRERR